MNIKNNYATIGCEKSFNTEIFELKTLKKVATINAQTHKEISCYFIEDNKGVSISYDNKELFFWDVNNM